MTPPRVARQILTGFDRRSRQLRREGERVAGLRHALEATSDTELEARWFEDAGSKRASAVAVCAEIVRRETSLTPNAAQLATTLGLLHGYVVELPTGEGKTLAGAMAAALLEKRDGWCHVLSANEYLAERDAAWMAPVYNRLGLTVAAVVAGQNPSDKKTAYAADVTYGTAQEIGFDYLRDGLRDQSAELVQRGLRAVIVDEVDAVLIDQARQPLVISERWTQSSPLQYSACGLVESLRRGIDFEVDHERMTVSITDAGAERLSREIGADLFSGARDDWLQAIWVALRARGLYERGRDYIVRDGRVEVVDEYTGRTLKGRRWNEGLHQAIEIKERLMPSTARRSMAEISIPSLMSLYASKCGMTGTAVEEEIEFARLYRLEVVVIKPNKPCRRLDLPDAVYDRSESRDAALIPGLAAAQSQGRPVLVGCASVNSLVDMSELLTKNSVPHRNLDARNEYQDAQVLGSAGAGGAVTLTTQLAGRGVDIKLDEGARTAGGLKVLGIELFESQRIDRQLRGRAGRQGDPGSSQFFISLQDPLLRLWGLEPPKTGTSTDGRMKSRRARRLVRDAQWVLSLRNRLLRSEFLAYDAVVDAQYRRVRQWHDEAVALDNTEEARVLTQRWADHLVELNALRDGIGLRTLGGESPLIAWRIEANEIFRRAFAPSGVIPDAAIDSTEGPAQEPPETQLARLGPPMNEPRTERVRLGSAGPLAGVRFGGWGGAPAGGARRADVVAVADADGSPLRRDA